MVRSSIWCGTAKLSSPKLGAPDRSQGSDSIPHETAQQRVSMPLFKRIVASSAFQGAVGSVAAWYLRLAWYSSRKIFEPATIYDTVQMPAIIAMWHGQHFLMPFIKRKDASHRAKVLISRHRDGELNARAAERLGIGTIRGSGAHNGEFHRKGGALAFTCLLEALAQGYNVALTADVPKVARDQHLG